MLSSNHYQNHTKDFAAFTENLQEGLSRLPGYFSTDPLGTYELAHGDADNPLTVDGVRFSIFAVGNDDDNPRISFFPEVPASVQNTNADHHFYDATNTDGYLFLEDIGADANLSDFAGDTRDIQNTLLAMARESIDELNRHGYDTVSTPDDLLKRGTLVLPEDAFDWSNFPEKEYLRLQQDLQNFDTDTADEDLPELYGSILVGDTAFDLQTMVNEAESAYDLACNMYYPHDDSLDDTPYAIRGDFAYDDAFDLSLPDPVQPLRDAIADGMSYVQFQKNFRQHLQHLQPKNKQDLLFLRSMHHNGKFFQSMRKAIIEEEAHKQAGRNLAKVKNLKETLIESLNETVRHLKAKGYKPAEIGQGLQEAVKHVTHNLSLTQTNETARQRQLNE